MNVFKGFVIGAFVAPTLFACQEVDSPVSPAAELTFVAHHSNGHGGGGGNGGGEPDPTFAVDIAGDVSGTADATGSIKGQIVANPFTLDISAIAAAVPNGATCFPAGAYTSVLALTQSSQDPDVVDVQMVFKAKGTDGTTDVKYALWMSGALQGDDWLPTGTSTIDLGIGSPDWTIGHDSGKGKNVACTGEGELAATVAVTAQ